MNNMFPLTVFIHALDIEKFQQSLDLNFPHCTECGARKAIGTDLCQNCRDEMMNSINST